MGEIAPPQTILLPTPIWLQNNFRCVKIRPNLTIQYKNGKFFALYVHFFASPNFLLPPSPKCLMLVLP